MISALLGAFGITAPDFSAPVSGEPLMGVECFVKASMIVPTVQEGFANVRVEIAQTGMYRDGFGQTLEQRRNTASRELEACLADLMAKAEVIREGHLLQTAAQPLSARRT